MTYDQQGVLDALRRNRKEFGAIWLSAICLTIVGNTVFEVVIAFTEYPHPSSWFPLEFTTAFWWRLIIFFAANLALFYAATVLEQTLRGFRRIVRVVSGQKVFAGWQGDVSPAPALILFVSKPSPHADPNAGKSHESAIAYHRDKPKPGAGPLRYVRLVASSDPGSIKAAKDAMRVLKAKAPDVDVDVEENQDFFNISAMHTVTRDLITQARDDLPDLTDPADVVVDITGGTAMVSVGAVLAGMELDATLEYVEPSIKSGKPSYLPKDVEIRRMRFDAVDTTTPVPADEPAAVSA